MKLSTIHTLTTVCRWLQDLLFALGCVAAVWLLVTFFYDVALPALTK